MIYDHAIHRSQHSPLLFSHLSKVFPIACFPDGFFLFTGFIIEPWIFLLVFDEIFVDQLQLVILYFNDKLIFFYIQISIIFKSKLII